jgi:hypothetical protein
MGGFWVWVDRSARVCYNRPVAGQAGFFGGPMYQDYMAGFAPGGTGRNETPNCFAPATYTPGCAPYPEPPATYTVHCGGTAYPLARSLVLRRETPSCHFSGPTVFPCG